MSRISVKVGQVVGLRLRNGLYALMQRISKGGTYAVFNLFPPSLEIAGEILNPHDVLFYCTPSRFCWRHSPLKHTKIASVEGLGHPRESIMCGSGAKIIKIWEGTPNERTVPVLGQGDIFLSRRKADDHFDCELTKLTRSDEDYQRAKNLEIMMVWTYPFFNERLYLCSVKGENFNPEMEITFNRPLGLECIPYIDMLRGKADLAALGY